MSNRIAKYIATNPTEAELIAFMQGYRAAEMEALLRRFGELGAIFNKPSRDPGADLQVGCPEAKPSAVS